jgi:glycosyltransferase involved in cell wall biosynthesis
MEAMACGLCVVSTNVGGLPYLIDDEVDGLLVPPNDTMAMAKAVSCLLTQPTLAVKLSENARNRAEKLDWSGILPQWENLLVEVIERHNVSPR